MQSYLSDTAGLLIRKSYSGIDQSQVFLAAHQYDSLISAGETATLMEMLKSVQRNIQQSIQMALDRSTAAQAAVKQTFQIQVQGDLNMSTFDQRGQKVAYQYNAQGDINFGAVQNQASFADELQKLRAEVTKAKEVCPHLRSAQASTTSNATGALSPRIHGSGVAPPSTST